MSEDQRSRFVITVRKVLRNSRFEAVKLYFYFADTNP